MNGYFYRYRDEDKDISMQKRDERKKMGLLRRFFSLKLWTVLQWLIAVPLAVVLIFSMTKIPVLSAVNILTMFTYHVSIWTMAVLVVSLLLYLTKKSKPRRFVLWASAVALACSFIISGSLTGLALKEGAQINFGEALTFRLNFAPDVEVEDSYSYDGENIGLSVWTPKNTDRKPAPIFVYIHGGGWASGDRHGYAAGHCKYFSDHGYLAISINYPLSTKDRHLWDKQEECIGYSFDWIAKHAEEYGGDIDNLFVGGESAGGNLAINVSTRINSGEIGKLIGKELPPIKAIAPLFPGVDPAAVYNENDPLYRTGQQELLKFHFGGSPEEYPERYAKITSSNIVDEKYTPPMMLMYAGNDHYVPGKSIRDFIDALNEKGITNKVVVVPFSDHVFNLIPGVIGGQIYEQVSCKWFEQYLGEGKA